MSKTCKQCNIEKPFEEFYVSSKRTDRRDNTCKECRKLNDRIRRQDPEYRAKRLAQQKEYAENNREQCITRGREYYASVKGRAKTLLKGVMRRSNDVDIDERFIIERIEDGFCEVTGIPFNMNPSVDTKKNPYAPSIDRIDSSKGYTRNNVQIVIWQYNLMKGEISHDDLLMICEKLIERRNDGTTA